MTCWNSVHNSLELCKVLIQVWFPLGIVVKNYTNADANLFWSCQIVAWLCLYFVSNILSTIAYTKRKIALLNNVMSNRFTWLSFKCKIFHWITLPHFHPHTAWQRFSFRSHQIPPITILGNISCKTYSMPEWEFSLTCISHIRTESMIMKHKSIKYSSVNYRSEKYRPCSVIF